MEIWGAGEGDGGERGEGGGSEAEVDKRGTPLLNSPQLQTPHKLKQNCFLLQQFFLFFCNTL